MAKRLALIIGITEYADSRRNLKYAHKDAEAVYDVLLTHCGFQPEDVEEPLCDKNATRKEIETKLKAILQKAGKEDHVFFYYSGHGILDLNGQEPQYYLTAHDTNFSNILTENAIHKEILLTYFKNTNAKSITFFIDSCHSGALANEKAGETKENISRYFESLRGEAREGIVSSMASEKSKEDTEFKHGTFTHYFLEGIKSGKAAIDGKITVAGLYVYLEGKVRERSKEQQQPTYIVPTKVEGPITLAFVPKETPPSPETWQAKWQRLAPKISVWHLYLKQCQPILAKYSSHIIIMLFLTFSVGMYWKINALERQLKNKDEYIPKLRSAVSNLLSQMEGASRANSDNAEAINALNVLIGDTLDVFVENVRLQQHFSYQRAIYISDVSLFPINALSHSKLKDSRMFAVIQKAIFSEIEKYRTGGNAILKYNPVHRLFHQFFEVLRIVSNNNEQAHYIPDTNESILRLQNILTSNVSDSEMVRKINQEMMDPYGVDVIITGMYEYQETSGMVNIKLSLITRKQIFEALSIPIEEENFLCLDQAKTPHEETECKKRICPLVTEKVQMLIELFLRSDDVAPNERIMLERQLASLETLRKQMQQQEEIPLKITERYITTLAFIDGNTKKSLLNSEIGMLIQTAIQDGIGQVQKSIPSIKYNQKGHNIPDNEETIKKLIDITYDPTLSGVQKLEKFEREMMTPNNVDVIISGQFIDQGASARVRPFTIDRISQKVISKDVTFDKADFVCADPNDANKKILCKDTHEEIVKLVKELLEQL